MSLFCEKISVLENCKDAEIGIISDIFSAILSTVVLFLFLL